MNAPTTIRRSKLNGNGNNDKWLHPDIAARMKKLGMGTLSELARRSEIKDHPLWKGALSSQSVGAYLYGEREITLVAAVKIAGALQFSLERFFEIYEEIQTHYSRQNLNESIRLSSGIQQISI